MAKQTQNGATISGIGKDPQNNLTVQKSLPLFSLWRSDMGLADFKILDTYLSRINSHEPEKRTVVLTKGELENILGVKKINAADLYVRINRLGRFIPLEHTDKKIRTVALFEEAECDKDEYGLWTVKLTCTASAMKYIFNIEQLGYLRYKLRCITSISSRYTYILFMYLETNRFRKSWVVSIDELKEILACETEELYKEFKMFNNRILKKCQAELVEKTECGFTYEPIRTGRKVTAIRFSLDTLSDSFSAANPEQLSLEDLSDLVEENPNAIYAEVLPHDFTPDQVEALRTLAAKRVYWDSDFSLPRECAIANYLRDKVVMMRAHNRNVKHPYSYLEHMILNDREIV